MMIDMIFDWVWRLDWWPFVALLGFVWAPKTWTPGELVSAAAMNTNIRDHLNESLRVQTTALTGTQNNFAVEGPFAYLQCTNASALVITGALIDSGNVNGAKIFVEALDARVSFTNQGAGSTTSNRILTADAEDLVLETYDRVLLIYDGTNERWRAVHTARSLVEKSLGDENLLANPNFIIWPAGDTADPSHWYSSGAGSSIQRCGTGLADTKRKHGIFCARLRYGAATAYLDQNILPAADYDDGFDGSYFSVGVWVWTDSSDAKVGFDDGDTPGYSAAHAGDSAWEWMTFTFQIGGAATQIVFRNKLNAAGDMYVSWPSVVKGKVPPAEPLFCPVVRSSICPTLSGNPLAAGVYVWGQCFGRPFIVEDVQIECISVTTGQKMVLDINQWAGAWQSMFTTKPEVALGASRGGEQPDGTYQYRCFEAGFGTSITNALIGIDVDQAATGGGKNPTVAIRILGFRRPQEALLGYNSVGVT